MNEWHRRSLRITYQFVRMAAASLKQNRDFPHWHDNLWRQIEKCRRHLGPGGSESIERSFLRAWSRRGKKVCSGKFPY